MAEPHLPRFSRLEFQRNKMREIVLALTDDTLVDVLRIAGTAQRPLEEGPGTDVADGFPTRSSGAGDTSRGSSESTSTERAALHDNRAQVDEDEPDRWVQPFDPVDELVGRFIALMSETLGHLRELDRARIHIDGHKRQLHGRVSSLLSNCECCGRSVAGVKDDRIKAGFCSGKSTNWCYETWLRAGRPERAPWIATRSKELKAKNAHREQAAER